MTLFFLICGIGLVIGLALMVLILIKMALYSAWLLFRLAPIAVIAMVAAAFVLSGCVVAKADVGLPPPSGLTWTPLPDKHSDLNTRFIDLQHIQTANGMAIVWELDEWSPVTYDQSQGAPANISPPAWSMVSEMAYNCDRPYVRAIYVAQMSGHMGGGIVVDGGYVNSDWRPLDTKDMPEEAIYRAIACNHPIPGLTSYFPYRAGH